MIITGGEENGVVGCDISDTGFTAISMTGGDRNTLTSGKHYADNNHIHDIARVGKTRGRAINLRGCGLREAGAIAGRPELLAEAEHLAHRLVTARLGAAL